MKYNKQIKLTEREKEAVNYYLQNTFYSYETLYTKTIVFDNGYFMDIMICANCDDTPYTQGVLYNKDGQQLSFTDTDDNFPGEWILYADNNTYIVNII